MKASRVALDRLWSDRAIHRFKAECAESKTSPYVRQGFYIQNMVYEAGDNIGQELAQMGRGCNSEL